MDLSERKQKILQAIIDEYVTSAEPVGSRAISKRNELGLSSATIRNEMADLEDMGYLVKPHTSAGRIPSDSGYRFYVNSLMHRYQMSVEAIEQLRMTLEERVSRLDTLIKKASIAASALTDYATVVTSPRLGRSVLCKIDLVKLAGGSLMLILVTRSGLVKNEVFKADIDEESTRLISETLNKALCGKVCGAICAEDYESIVAYCVTQLGLPVAGCAVVVKFVADMIDRLEETDVYINNARLILKYPEFSDIGKAREMLEFLENKENLAKIIEPDSEHTGVGVRIGAENDFKELENSSLVTVNYSIGGRRLGRIGVIGPKRMNYAKVIASLDCISSHIDNIIEQLYSREGEGTD